MKLFGYLPETLFQPLSGPKKHVYARLLMRLYERVYSARVLETPLREEVVRQIEIGLSEFGIGSMGDLSEGDPEEDQTTSQAHYLAYYRLRDTGWLTEETEKWRTYVDINPDAFMVLGAITDFGNSRVRVAGAVVDVKNNLEAAYREPEIMAQGLANAHDTALRLARSMRRILAGMREIEDRILGNPNAAAIPRTFFQDFVDGLLIADYKQLKTSNNPYRHRRTIASLAGDMLADADRLGKIARAYIEQGVMAAGATIATAEERVIAELEKIKSVFEDVGPFMDKIEDFRDRLAGFCDLPCRASEHEEALGRSQPRQSLRSRHLERYRRKVPGSDAFRVRAAAECGRCRRDDREFPSERRRDRLRTRW